MKPIQLPFLGLLLQTTLTLATKVDPMEVKNARIVNDNKVVYINPSCDPKRFKCSPAEAECHTGKQAVLSVDRRYFGCCEPGQHLSGSPETEWHCCGAGHEVTGSLTVGYSCCSPCSEFDGKQCNKICQNGKILVNGQCACPSDKIEAADGTCVDKPKCDSGLETGKCYLFVAENGRRLGLNNDGNYYAGPESMNQRYGKFQLCKDKDCTPGWSVNPADGISIKDTYGKPKNGENPGEWLDRSTNGDHIKRTPDFDKAGRFSLSKWPCGKYCLGGFNFGLGPACPSESPALTMYTNDPQMCVPMKLVEVPCNIQANENNCIWKNNKDQCCGGNVDCTGSNSDCDGCAVPYHDEL